jgi:hypothetical protein
MKVFEEFENVADMVPCRKRPIVVHCKEITEEFRVKTLEGDYAQGKPGDFLMRGINGELYIHDRELFFKAYDILDSDD